MGGGGTGDRLARLRTCMQSNKYSSEPLDAYLVRTDDAHQSEYIADCDKRREFISGFTGSAGVALVTADVALLWTDGRYHLQASQQLDANWTIMKQGNEGVPSIEEWMSKQLPAGAKIGFDPYQLSEELHKDYMEALESSGQELVAVSVNLVDVAWGSDRPSPPCNPLLILPLKYSGRSWEDKVSDVRKEMEKNRASVLVVTALDEVAWLFNLRGSDIDYNPVFFAYAIVTTTDVRLLTNERRINEAVRDHLGEENGVKVYPYDGVAGQITELLRETEGKVWINSKSSYALCHLVPKARRVSTLSPLQLLKAVKNNTEAQGMRNSHIRDAAALCEYLHWLEEEVPKGGLTEISAADKLEELRKVQPDYVSLSFPTISSSGPNGAIIHYKPTLETDRNLSVDELYLCDSGAQYMDGTTDVTRTVHFGTPTEKQKEAFTLVLKGHIALCKAVFPNKTNGHQIEGLARAPLWAAGLNYKHGTGHGVGAFLNVHEGPQSIGPRASLKPLSAGMFVSDEPGYYEDGSFGVRIENVVIIKPTETKYNFAGVGYLTMEPVTLVPIQHKMILPDLLTQSEVDWVNGYHTECRKKVGAYLTSQGKAEVVQWLEKQTQPLSPALNK